MKFIPIVIHHENDTCYGVVVPGLPGCFSAGDSLKDACKQVREAINLHIASLVEDEGIKPENICMDISLETASEEAFSSDGIIVVIEHAIEYDIKFTQ